MPEAPAHTYSHGVRHHEETLEQARTRAHKKADRLDKMTPEQYAAEKGKRRERREKWQHMTPEERAAARKEGHERYLKRHHADTSGGSSVSDAAPPPRLRLLLHPKQENNSDYS